MKIIEKKVEELIPYVNNPRNNEAAVDFVAASIKEFGFKNPIIIDKDGVIVAGHTRLAAAKKLGLESVPCIMADDLSEQQIKAFRLADNKTAELATWDLEKLEIELEGIDDLEMTDFGFEQFGSFEDDEEKELERQKREFEERMAAGELSEDSEEYQEFLQKFEAKRTTDDCYTPETVYEAVAEYVSKRYNVKRTSFVRPFVPNGDYEHYNYPKDCAVVDNPPFSILSEILKFYTEHNIKYFLFAPSVTIFSGTASSSATAICTGLQITYENGAVVPTSFLTNMEDREIQFMSAPELYAMVKAADEQNLREWRRQLPKYEYPMEVMTAVMLTPFSRYGIEFEVRRDECYKIRMLDCQKGSGKAIFGGGYLISDKVKAEREKAEREKAEREKAEREKAEREKAEREKAERWELSEREKEIIKTLK